MKTKETTFGVSQFISYLEGKGLAKSTQRGILFKLQMFFKWAKTEDIQITKPDILKYLEYLKNRKGYQNISRQNHLTALNHYFTYLYKVGETSTNPCFFLKIRGTEKRQMYKLYSCEELDTLFDAYYQLFVRNYDSSKFTKTARIQSQLCRERNAVILSILLNQGVITGEIERMKISDLDLTKAVLKITGGILGADRVLPIKATQMGLFINYLQNIRPQFMEYQTKETDKLFLSLPYSPDKKTDGGTLVRAFCILSKQLKTIDKQFLNFQQVRASLITFWLKTYGLRKAQYLAGHRCVSTTEKYQINNLDGLIDDINKLHPLL